MRFLAIICLLTVVGIVGCDGPAEPKGKGVTQVKTDRLAKLVSPQHGQNLTLKDSFVIQVDVLAETNTLELKLYLNGEEVHVSKSKGARVALPANAMKLGQNQVEYVLKTQDGKTERRFADCILLADEPQEKQTFRTLRSFPHDQRAYTQGLIWHEGFLFEGTGQYGQSSLRKVDLKTGKVLQNHKLTSSLFGEGVTLWNGELIQLTWQARKGFVYNLNTFEQVRTFDYATEGWGITHDGKNLILSDGTEKLYFLNPKTFEVESHIEAYNHQGKLTQLNELEYINGEIWANIYTTMEIARIDPSNGRVKALIDFRGIVDQEDIHSEMDHFNGIAYDPVTGNIYVTGKNWKKVYQVEVLPAG